MRAISQAAPISTSGSSAGQTMPDSSPPVWRFHLAELPFQVCLPDQAGVLLLHVQVLQVLLTALLIVIRLPANFGRQ